MLQKGLGFFDQVKQIVSDYQPVNITGALIHPYYWLTSKASDYIYPISKSHDREGIDIYCIPGTADYPKSLSRLAERLIAKDLKGINSITLVSFANRFQGKGIDEFSQELLNKIRMNQHKRIILIGHSRGGLIASKTALLLKALYPDLDVVVICLGTPYHGSYLARKPASWFSDSVEQMETGSDYLKNLTEQIMQSGIAHYFMVAGHDWVVPSGAYIQEYVDKVPDSLFVFPRHGHLSLVSSHQLVNTIYEIVTQKTQELMESVESDELFNLDEMDVDQPLTELVTTEEDMDFVFIR